MKEITDQAIIVNEDKEEIGEVTYYNDGTFKATFN